MDFWFLGFLVLGPTALHASAKAITLTWQLRGGMPVRPYPSLRMHRRYPHGREMLPPSKPGGPCARHFRTCHSQGGPTRSRDAVSKEARRHKNPKTKKPKNHTAPRLLPAWAKNNLLKTAKPLGVWVSWFLGFGPHGAPRPRQIHNSGVAAEKWHAFAPISKFANVEHITRGRKMPLRGKPGDPRAPYLDLPQQWRSQRE